VANSDVMRILVIYYDDSDMKVLNYVRDFAKDILIYTPDENRPIPGYNNFHGDLLEILEKLKGNVDVIAFKKRKNYPTGSFFIGDLIDRLKSMGFKILVIS
jgi:hypothetical protein